MKVKFIIPLPDTNYYLWQAIVQMNNFKKWGYEVDTHYLIGVVYGTPNPHALDMANSPEVKAKVHLYIDEREGQEKAYSASLKPYLMYRYFKDNPWEKDCAYVYLDADVIFLEAFDFTPYLNDDIWYGSDVGSYINSGYIKQKGGDELLKDFTEHAGVTPELITANDDNCIGAQYITKNNIPEYWFDVYKKSAETYNYMNSRQNYYFKSEMIYWLQIWTMEMWLTIWELWRIGVQTEHTEDWEFHWANHMVKDRKHKIYHNAGIAEQDQTKTEHFAKRAYENKTPFNNPLVDIVSKDSLSYMYVTEIKESEKNYPSLVWD